MVTLSETRRYGQLDCMVVGNRYWYPEEDVIKFINKTLKELTVENPDTINEYSNRRLLESFKENFGDAILGDKE